MTSTISRLRAEAMQLSETERADLADLLWASVIERGNVDAAWDAEIKRRVAELDAGLTVGFHAEDVFSEARRIISQP